LTHTVHLTVHSLQATVASDGRNMTNTFKFTLTILQAKQNKLPVTLDKICFMTLTPPPR